MCMWLKISCPSWDAPIEFWNFPEATTMLNVKRNDPKPYYEDNSSRNKLFSEGSTVIKPRLLLINSFFGGDVWKVGTNVKFIDSRFWSTTIRRLYLLTSLYINQKPLWQHQGKRFCYSCKTEGAYNHATWFQ